MTGIFGIPELQGTDSPDVVFANRRLFVLEVLMRATVADDSLSAPPGGTIPRGHMFIVSGTASGLWAGQAAGTLAIALTETPTSAAGWHFIAPSAGNGFTVRIAAPTPAHKYWNGTAWTAV